VAKPGLAATELAVPIGSRVVDVLDLAYRARRPVLLEGATGIGKSQIVSEFARRRGLAVVVLDLSLLEPPDLVGLPVIEGGRTRYASPAELPVSGRGVLLLEELNRAEIPVMQPALQLLSARRLHSYELPPDWVCIAAINPEDGDYQVNHLDAALRARFLQLTVCSERDAWLVWAEHANVHPVILRVARDHEDLFEHASPRSWAYASELLHVLRPEELADADLVRVTLRGYLPTSWSIRVAEALAGFEPTPGVDAATLLGPGGEAELARIVSRLESAKRIDAVAMLAATVRRILGGEALRAGAEAGTVTLERLEKLLAPLPGDLREQCLDSAVESRAASALLRGLGQDAATLVASYGDSPFRREVQTWRRELVVHRVRLVVAAVLNWLGGDRPRDVSSREAEGLVALAGDAGPLGEELVHWLRARGLAPEPANRGSR
jgi:hypothetical protein